MSYDWREHWEEKTRDGDTVLFVAKPNASGLTYYLVTDVKGHTNWGMFVSYRDSILTPRVREPELCDFDNLSELPDGFWTRWLFSFTSGYWISVSAYFNACNSDQILCKINESRNDFHLAPHPGAPAVPFGKVKVK